MSWLSRDRKSREDEMLENRSAHNGLSCEGHRQKETTGPIALCPFCNYDAYVCQPGMYFKVWCLNKECNTIGPDGRTPEIAIAKWNSKA